MTMKKQIVIPVLLLIISNFILINCITGTSEQNETDLDNQTAIIEENTQNLEQEGSELPDTITVVGVGDIMLGTIIPSRN